MCGVARIQESQQYLVVGRDALGELRNQEDWLTIEPKAFVFQGLSKLCRAANLRVAPFQLSVFGLVDVDTVSPQVFRRVTGHVCLGQQLARALRVCLDRRHTDTDPDTETASFPAETEILQGRH